METKTLLKITFFSLLLSSCGFLDKWKTPDTQVESTASRSTTSFDDSFTDDMENLEVESFVDNEAAPTAQSFVAEAQKPTDEIGVIENINKATAMPAIHEEEMSNMMSGETAEYHVKAGETYMQIAFKLYGDVSKWKDIKALNPQVKEVHLRAGTKLKYERPAQEFVWLPTGTPYLIKTGDTLGTISNSFYQTTAKWKELWQHNKKLITNPNRIYAGFTMFAPDLSATAAVETERSSYVTESNSLHDEEIAVEQVLKDTKKSASKTQSVSQEANVSYNDIDEDQLVDETIQQLSATQRAELDKMNSEEYELSNEIQELEAKYGSSISK